MRYAGIVHDAVHSSRSHQDLVIFVHRIQRQKEHCLSFAQTLTSRYESRTDDRMQIERTSDMKNLLEEVALNNHIVL